MLPAIVTNTLASATTSAGSFVYTMSNIDRASLQLNATWDTTDTSTVTLTCSNDGVNFVAFPTAKTLAVSGTTSGLFDLGAINYVYLKVAWTQPATHRLTLVGIMNQVPTFVQNA